MTIDKHALAQVSTVGSSLEALGALCLAYGREHRPLRILARGVTYCVPFRPGPMTAQATGWGVAVAQTHT
jgi:hypothetical protein